MLPLFGGHFLSYIGMSTYFNSCQTPMTLYPNTFPIFLCLRVDVFHVEIWLLKTFVKTLEVERNLSKTILNTFAFNREVAISRIVSSINWTLGDSDSGLEDCGPYPSLRGVFSGANAYLGGCLFDHFFLLDYFHWSFCSSCCSRYTWIFGNSLEKYSYSCHTLY